MVAEELTPRQKQILIEIVDNYIETAEPVGSRTISRKSVLKLSSATIRNEMQDLEELGYIYQPYTSAGRLPTIKGYRFFVKKLLETKDKLETEVSQFEEEFKKLKEKCGNEKLLLEEIARVFSDISKSPSIVAISKGKEEIKKISLVKLSKHNYLLLVILSNGEILKEEVHFEKDLSLQSVQELEQFLNDNFLSLSLQKLKDKIKKFEEDRLGALERYRKQLQKMLHAFKDFLSWESLEIKTVGKDNVFSIPEFQKIEKLKNILSYLESYEIAKLFSSVDKFLIKVGLEELGNKELSDLSIIGTYFPHLDSYLALCGPLRMDYRKNLSLLYKLTNLISCKEE